MLDQIKKLKDLIDNASPETLAKSIDDCHFKGVFSLVIGGEENGTLTRVFMSEKEISPYDVQLHSHRYDLKITTLTNGIRHHVKLARPKRETKFLTSEYKYQSPWNGGKGLEYLGPVVLSVASYDLPSLALIDMCSDDVHTVSCRAGSMWVVEEGGFTNLNHSYVYGSPFILDGLYNKPSQYQIADRWQAVKKVIKKHLLDLQMAE